MKVKLLFIGLVSATVSVFATERYSLNEGFEQGISGQRGESVRRLWGKAGDTRVAITNENAGAGEKSLVFDIKPGKTHGYVMKLPKASEGVYYVLSYKFMRIGTGASFGWELRSNYQNRVLGWSLGKDGFVAYSTVKDAKNAKDARQKFGAIENNVWYDVTIKFPVNQATGDVAVFKLVNEKSKTNIIKEVSYNAPEEFGNLCFNVPTTENSYKIFIDDITLSVDKTETE